MYRTLAQRRSTGSASSNQRWTPRAVYLIDYLTWHARLTGSTRPLSAGQPPTDDIAKPTVTLANAKAA
jgi:hypothetical protein